MEKKSVVLKNINPLTKEEDGVKNNDGSNSDHKNSTSTRKSRRLSRWFVSNQKTEEWNENKLKQLHLVIILLIFFMYTCHVIASPFIKFIEDETVITIIRIFQIVALITSVVCFVIMCRNNGSLSATKMLFAKDTINTYIYIFWILRSFIIELLKGQIVFSFVHVFHSIVIYSSDTWYLCNQRVLLCNVFMLLLVVSYEFLVSISPVGPSEPSWSFMNIKTTANSLSRSNYFNLFVIFTDALIVIIFDPKRSKYVMLVDVCKRNLVEVSVEKAKKLMMLWKVKLTLVTLGGIIYVSDQIFPYPEIIFNIMLGGTLIPAIFVYFILVKNSSKDIKKTVYKLLQQRNIVFVLIVLAVLFYIDNIYFHTSISGLIFPILIWCYIMLDAIGGFFPGRLSKFLMVLMVLILSWNIFSNTFLKMDCEERTLQWGIFGERISYCTIKRLIYQTILSLLVSAMIATIMGRTKYTFFITANLYRSTGTIYYDVENEAYVENMNSEKKRKEARV
jgi:hypothetical protein